MLPCRCVADEQRSLALGVQSLMFRAFGSIPGPIVFGVIFDSACLFWQFECGRRGNCWVYDNVDLSNRALGLAVSGVVLNFIFSFLSWLVYPKNRADEEKNSESKKSDQDEENVKDNASVASSDSYTIGGPAIRPIQRTSLVGRMESHCSEDLLLDSTDTGHIDDNIPMTDLSGGRGHEIHDATVRSNAIVETETALHENYMHNMRARSFGSTSPVQVVASPPQ